MLTWGANGQWCKASAENDTVRGPQRLKRVVWYATGATAGTTLLEVSEVSTGTPIVAAAAEATHQVKELSAPAGILDGLKVSDLDGGFVILHFEERPAEKVTAKGIHDASPLVPEE